jgi:metallo-beta-lactamase family protein
LKSCAGQRHIQEKEAEWQLRHRHRRGQVERGIPAPLYSVAQALDALKLLQPVAYRTPIKPLETVTFVSMTPAIFSVHPGWK